MEIFPEMPHFHGTFRNISMEMMLRNLMEMNMEINGNDLKIAVTTIIAHFKFMNRTD